jgi:hypothetical protein
MEQPTDRNGYPADAYPDSHLSGVFLGINGDGIGEYLTTDYVFLAEYTGDDIQVPPPEYGMAHEFYLDEMSVGEYIAETTEESGPWIFLSESARESLRDAGFDPKEHLEEIPN